MSEFESPSRSSGQKPALLILLGWREDSLVQVTRLQADVVRTQLEQRLGCGFSIWNARSRCATSRDTSRPGAYTTRRVPGCWDLTRRGQVLVDAQRGRGRWRFGERLLRQWASFAAATASTGSGTAALFSAALEQPPRLRHPSAHTPRHARRQRPGNPSPSREGRRSCVPAHTGARRSGLIPLPGVLLNPKGNMM